MDPRDFDRVFAAVPGNLVLLATTPGFPVVAMSAQLQAMLGETVPIIGRPIFELFPEAPAAAGSVGTLTMVFERVIRTRATERHEQRFDILDPATGRFKEHYWSAISSPILDDAGEVKYILHQSEDAATERRHGSMAILDAMTEGVFTLDRQWRFSYVNPEAGRLLRSAPERLVGEVIWDRFPGADASEFGTHYRRAMQERTTHRFTAFYPGLDGWYQVTVYPAPEGISVYFHEVTAQVLAERDRERMAVESEHQRRIYETALGNTPDFVYVFGIDHRAIYANQALLKVWGVEDVRGKIWMDLGYEQWHADMHDREIDQVIATRAPIRGEIPFTGTNGRRIYDYIFAPVFDAAGEVVAVAGTTRDITERQAALQIIREHADRLAEADRAKDAFLATLSHELRNPLAPLRNGLEVLRRTGEPTERQASIHAMMGRQVDHLVRLVDELMEVSRITRGHVSLQNEVVALVDIVDSALETTRPLLEGNGQSVALRLPDHPVFVHGDRVRLSQILSNLLNNAAKYSSPGSTITVESVARDGVVSLAVRDEGMGMFPAEIPQLFEMFARGDRARMAHQGGLGIGLSLSRHLAALHGGTLDATSQGPGTGSVFELRLPTLEHAALSMASPDPIDGVRLSLRILVADDNIDVGESLATTLRLAGADVRFEHDGVAALDAYDAFRPDVVILDIGMPGMTGYDVARALRAGGARIPVIALTGWGQAADRERAMAAEFSHHLVKPVPIAALLDLLKSLEPSA